MLVKSDLEIDYFTLSETFIYDDAKKKNATDNCKQRKHAKLSEKFLEISFFTNDMKYLQKRIIR